MNPFHLFCHDTYYPLAGLGDYQGVFLSLDDVHDHLRKGHISYDYYNVLQQSPEGPLVYVERGEKIEAQAKAEIEPNNNFYGMELDGASKHRGF